MARCARTVRTQKLGELPVYIRCASDAVLSVFVTALISLEDSPRAPNLEYEVEMCAEHGAEYQEA